VELTNAKEPAMNRRALALAVVLALLATSAALADEDAQVRATAPLWAHPHLYLGGRVMGFAAARTCFDLGDACMERWGGGLGVFAGYRLAGPLAIEGNWSMTLHDGADPVDPTFRTSIYLMTLTADAKYHLRGHGPVEPYVQAGVGFGLYGQTGGRLPSAGDFTGKVLTATTGLGVDVWVSDYLSLGGRFVYRAIFAGGAPESLDSMASAITVDCTATLHF
jgi:hypothetical protein